MLAGICLLASALFISDTWLWMLTENPFFLLMLHSTVQRRLTRNNLAGSVNSVVISILSCKYITMISNLIDFQIVNKKLKAKLFHYLKGFANILKHMNIHKSNSMRFVLMLFFLEVNAQTYTTFL